VSKKKAREIEERKRKNRNKVLTVVIALITLVSALFIGYLVFFNGNGPDAKLWHLDSDGLLAFEARPAVQATVNRLRRLRTGRWTKSPTGASGTRSMPCSAGPRTKRLCPW
jgi:hypothetical protein